MTIFYIIFINFGFLQKIYIALQITKSKPLVFNLLIHEAAIY